MKTAQQWREHYMQQYGKPVDDALILAYVLNDMEELELDYLTTRNSLGVWKRVAGIYRQEAQKREESRQEIRSLREQLAALGSFQECPYTEDRCGRFLQERGKGEYDDYL